MLLYVCIELGRNEYRNKSIETCTPCHQRKLWLSQIIWFLVHESISGLFAMAPNPSSANRQRRYFAPLIGGLLWHMVLLPPSRDPNVNLTVRDSYSSRSTLLVMLVTTLVLLAGEAAAGRSDASAD